MPSPSKPSDFSNLVLTSSSTLCDRFKAALLTLPSKLYDFVNYVLDANGNPSKTFAKDLLSNTGIWSIGDLKSTLSSTTPDGWIDCEGQTVSRTIYSDLFSSSVETSSLSSRGASSFSKFSSFISGCSAFSSDNASLAKLLCSGFFASGILLVLFDGKIATPLFEI